MAVTTPVVRAVGALASWQTENAKPSAQVTMAAARIVGAPVPPATPLMQAGMDSLGAVELRRELAAALGAPRGV